MTTTNEAVKTIDCTPTWLGLLPAMLDLYVQFDNELRNDHYGRKNNASSYKDRLQQENSLKNIRKQFQDLASAADRYNEIVKEYNKLIAVITELTIQKPLENDPLAGLDLQQQYRLWIDGFKDAQIGNLSFFIAVWGEECVRAFINKSGHYMTTFQAI